MKVRILVSVFSVVILCLLSGFISTSSSTAITDKMTGSLNVNAKNSSGQCVDYSSVSVTWSGGSLSGTTGHINNGCGANTCQIGRISWSTGIPGFGTPISITVTKGTYTNTLNTTMAGGAAMYDVNIGAAAGSNCCGTSSCIPD